jgi:hypothetical protein
MSDTDQPGADAGLLDTATVEDPQASAQANPQAAEIDHKAATPGAEIPGTPRTKPEYLPDNFWDAESGEANLEAMAKSWTDLRKMVSQGKHKAPANGEYDTSGFKDADKDPVAQASLAWAKKWGISQAAFDEMAGQFGNLAEQLAPPAIDAAAEMKQLGPNGPALINGMVDWARGLVNRGVWGPDDFDEFRIMGGTARGLRALVKIREAYEGRVPIESVPIEGAPSKEELYQMVADPKYQSDAAYRQKVEKMFAQHVR